jgi:lysine N6-hydroxylase
MSEEALDLVGVGIGPSNLSLAALLDPVDTISRGFFERREAFFWHEGQMLPEVELQQIYVKDLVSLVAPCSRFSFISYLHATGRIHAFLNARFSSVLRLEFNCYLQWACGLLRDLHFGENVHSIKFDGNLIVESDTRRICTGSVVLGTGQAPAIPACAEPHLSDSVFHASEFMRHGRALAGKSVAIVGGGQTGAEVFLELIGRDTAARPKSITWLSRRSNFLPLDDTPFVNEQFSPNYSDYFYGLGHQNRMQLLAEQKLASDGISISTLTRIYQRMYELQFLRESVVECRLRPLRSMTALAALRPGWRIGCTEITTGAQERLDVDTVVLCTGFEYRVPECLSSIVPRISWGDDGFALRPDFSIEWDGPPDRKIYVQNAARPKRGVADPNLSLLSWRSAKIVNSLAKQTLYPLVQPRLFVTFGPAGESSGNSFDEAEQIRQDLSAALVGV